MNDERRKRLLDTVWNSLYSKLQMDGCRRSAPEDTHQDWVEKQRYNRGVVDTHLASLGVSQKEYALTQICNHFFKFSVWVTEQGNEENLRRVNIDDYLELLQGMIPLMPVPPEIARATQRAPSADNKRELQAAMQRLLTFMMDRFDIRNLQNVDRENVDIWTNNLQQIRGKIASNQEIRRAYYLLEIAVILEDVDASEYTTMKDQIEAASGSDNNANPLWDVLARLVGAMEKKIFAKQI
jgi:hypothetical protein